MINDAYTRTTLHRRAAEYYRLQRPPKEKWENIRALEPVFFEYEHLLNAGEYNEACALIDEIDSYFLMRWGYAERLLSMRERLLGNIPDPQLNVQNLRGIGGAYAALGESKEAIKYLEQALEVTTVYKIRNEEGIVLGTLAPAYFDLGLYDKAKEYYERSIKIAREGEGDLLGESLRIGGLAVVYRELGELNLALDYLKNALGKANKLFEAGKGSRSAVGVHQKNIGDIYRLIAYYPEAEKNFKEALVISKEPVRRSMRSEHEALSGLASIFEDAAEFDKAFDYTNQALSITIEIHEKDSEGYKRRDLGRILVWLGKQNEGLQSLVNALKIADELSIPRLRHYAGYDLAWANLISGRISEAVDAIERAHEFITGRNSANTHALSGVVFARSGDIDKAITSFEAAIVAADDLLARTPSFFSAKYAKALALSGLLLLQKPNSDDISFQIPLNTYQSAIASCRASGVVKYILSILEALEPIDRDGVLSVTKQLLIADRENKTPC
jgi:tetratricopeptide (TPR) repeat protein